MQRQKSLSKQQRTLGAEAPRQGRSLSKAERLLGEDSPRIYSGDKGGSDARPTARNVLLASLLLLLLALVAIAFRADWVGRATRACGATAKRRSADRG